MVMPRVRCPRAGLVGVVERGRRGWISRRSRRPACRLHPRPGAQARTKQPPPGAGGRPAAGTDLAGGHADRTWEKRLRELVRPEVLVLDDFAMRQLNATQADDLYELVSERQGRSLIITSNRAPNDWYPLFPNPVVAESLLDRLINTSHQVIMNGPSCRPNKRPKNRADKPSTK
uniref:ATP-binding protein n=1 Tax=Streptomyces boluensis TaxID=1775135 RepID=UPI0028AA35CF|nr:ATP-binding protein [Streptomyces boluensis]